MNVLPTMYRRLGCILIKQIYKVFNSNLPTTHGAAVQRNYSNKKVPNR